MLAQFGSESRGLLSILNKIVTNNYRRKTILFKKNFFNYKKIMAQDEVESLNVEVMY